jgi:hypothetical protein
MTDWNADFDALVQETMAITKSISVEPPIPRTIIEPNPLPAVNRNNSERDEIRERVANLKAPGALGAGPGGLRSVPD